ncbi:MAG: ATP-binding cassette domain-containing protein [Blautia sp.]|nr:ATP-binding cassette domain-containing protein [Blautia sp.]
MQGGNSGRLPAAGLVFFEGQEKPRQYVIFQEAVVKGKCPMEVFTTSSLQLEYSFLAEEQSLIFARDGTWYFKNLTDDVFTFVDGKHVKCGDEAELRDGCVIRLVNERMLTAVFFANYVSGRDWRILNMDDGRHTVNITEKKGNEAGSSLSFEFENGHWSMQDFLAEEVLHNGAPVKDKIRIRIDDMIQIGDTRFVFEGSGLVYGYPLQESGLSIQIDERSVHKALGKVTLLKDINLSIEPGNMVMILGGSGAGKSTFVNAVTGYEKAQARITEGELDYYRNYNQVKHRIGFVPQDNLMRDEDTVGSTVANAADLRLPRNMSSEEKQRRIAAVLETFGLTGREKELVSKLSGGQKKRLSICMEFIASPSLFILDEPDSGLDGIMARELMENLRLIACQGKIVMVITHAPDRVAELFDKVIVLGKNSETHIGQLAFYGGIQEARDFFGVSTLEDVVKRINAKNEGGEGRADEFIEKYRVYSAARDQTPAALFSDEDVSDETDGDWSGQDRAEDHVKSSFEKARYKSRLGQIPVYLGKQFRLMINEMNWKVLPMAAVIAFLVVYVLGRRMFRNMEYTKYGSLAVICVCIWNGMFNSIQVVCKERSIIKREHRAGLHITSYLAAHMIYQAVICLLQVAINIAIFRFFGMYFPDTGLVTGSFTMDLAISMFLVTYGADMLALMVSCFARTTTTAMTIMPFILVVQLVFAGGVFPLERKGAVYLSQFTLSNWGITAVNIAADYNSQSSVLVTEALGLMQGTGDDFIEKVHDVLEIEEVRASLEAYTAKQQQEVIYSYDRKNLLKCWMILVSFCVLYILVGLILLERIDKDKR